MSAKSEIKKSLGLIHVYTGDGKGKTTAALGLALRAIGNDLDVAMVQFMKCPQNYGEYEISKSLPHFKLLPMGRECLVYADTIEQEDYDAAAAALRKARELLYSDKYDLVILDEVNVALFFGLIKVDELIEILRERPPNIEVVLTGRGAPPEVLELADLVTEMRCHKHPYEKGIPARDGIER